jgi:type II pantothenate kinase
MSADAQTDKLPAEDSKQDPNATPPSTSNTNSLPLRMRTNTAEIDSTITHPGSVKINVKGAFIVDQENGSPTGSGNLNGGNHETKDIRLPNHTAVVSHIAVDVSFGSSFLSSAFPSLTLSNSEYKLIQNGRLEAV